MDAKLKHLEFLQGVIARMASNSFVVKGWSITIAAALAAFAAVDSKATLVVIAMASSLLFWGLDGYYLWLERAFIKLFREVAAENQDEIDFRMTPDKSGAFGGWLKVVLVRAHLAAFYGIIIVIELVGAIYIRSK